MHGATIKIINAQQARLNNIYKNTKLKLLKTDASIWFNKICRDRPVHLPPCTRNNVYKHRICCHNNILTKKFIFLTRDFS